MRPKKYVKDWFSRREEMFPGYTYYAVGFWMLCFYVPLMTSKALGPYSRLVDVTIFGLGVAGFIFIYRQELREAYQDYKGERTNV